MKKILLLSLLSLFIANSSKLLATCNWKSNIKQIAIVSKDSCPNKYFYSSVSLSSSKGITYKWYNNNTTLSTSSSFSYTPTANGTYTICLKLTDTINKCDTIICTKNLWYNCIKPCNWKGRYPTFKTWDTCRGNGGVNNINGSISFNNNVSCFKYAWSVNNVVKGNGKSLRYTIYNNGTYTICVKVTDTCNKCDTTFCETKTISCFTSPCNWKKAVNSFVTWDTCNSQNKRKSLNGYVSFNTKGCYKYAWSVNGTAVGFGNTNTYTITQNGTYTYCLKLTDTCNKCDTTYCSTIKISCFPNTCNWKGRNAQFSTWDSCKTYNGKSNVNGYINFSNKCMKYQWKVNGNYAGNGTYMSNAITQNGTYNICVYVSDTCNKCDTVYCSKVDVTCFTQKCNWKGKYPTFKTFDSCGIYKGKTNSIGAYISFNSNSNCFKYQWTINNSAVYTPFNMFVKPLTQNGTYTICVKVTDTCNKCDTTFCETRTISCFKNACNWKGRYPTFKTWDSCKTRKGDAVIYGSISFNNSRSCFKYQWTVNGVVMPSTSASFDKIIANNGYYNICVKVTDTCNKCDTTFCEKRTINCFTNKCIWKNRITCFEVKDSCTGKYLYGKVCLATNNTTGCIKSQWTVGGSVIGTGNSFRYNLTKNGSYVVCVKLKDTCNNCDTTLCKTITVNCKTLGINTIENSNIKIYPNPANSILNIQIENAENSSYQMVNILGEVVLSGKLDNALNTINTNNLSNAIYILKITNNGNTQSFKIIIQQ